MAPTDETLMQRFQTGDRGALSALIERYREPALRFCYRMLHDPDMAEDMAQEGLARILLHPDHWSGRAKFSSYLFSILKNLCIDEMRWRSRWHGGTLENWDTADLGPLPEEQIARVEQQQEVQAALARLGPDHKAALILREFHGLPYEQISDVMGWSEAKTKITIYRARLALGRVLSANEGGERHVTR